MKSNLIKNLNKPSNLALEHRQNTPTRSPKASGIQSLYGTNNRNNGKDLTQGKSSQTLCSPSLTLEFRKINQLQQREFNQMKSNSKPSSSTKKLVGLFCGADSTDVIDPSSLIKAQGYKLGQSNLPDFVSYFPVQDLSESFSIQGKQQRRFKHKQKSFRLGDDDEEDLEKVNPLNSSLGSPDNYKRKVTLKNYLESIKEEESRSREEESHLYSMHHRKKGSRIDQDGSSLDLSKVQWPEINPIVEAQIERQFKNTDVYSPPGNKDSAKIPDQQPQVPGEQKNIKNTKSQMGLPQINSKTSSIVDTTKRTTTKDTLSSEKSMQQEGQNKQQRIPKLKSQFNKSKTNNLSETLPQEAEAPAHNNSQKEEPSLNYRKQKTTPVNTQLPGEGMNGGELQNTFMHLSQNMKLKQNEDKSQVSSQFIKNSKHFDVSKQHQTKISFNLQLAPKINNLKSPYDIQQNKAVLAKIFDLSLIKVDEPLKQTTNNNPLASQMTSSPTQKAIYRLQKKKNIKTKSKQRNSPKESSPSILTYKYSALIKVDQPRTNAFAGTSQAYANAMIQSNFELEQKRKISHANEQDQSSLTRTHTLRQSVSVKDYASDISKLQPHQTPLNPQLIGSTSLTYFHKLNQTQKLELSQLQQQSFSYKETIKIKNLDQISASQVISLQNTRNNSDTINIFDKPSQSSNVKLKPIDLKNFEVTKDMILAQSMLRNNSKLFFENKKPSNATSTSKDSMFKTKSYQILPKLNESKINSNKVEYSQMKPLQKAYNTVHRVRNQSIHFIQKPQKSLNNDLKESGKDKKGYVSLPRVPHVS